MNNIMKNNIMKNIMKKMPLTLHETEQSQMLLN